MFILFIQPSSRINLLQLFLHLLLSNLVLLFIIPPSFSSSNSFHPPFLFILLDIFIILLLFLSPSYLSSSYLLFLSILLWRILIAAQSDQCHHLPSNSSSEITLFLLSIPLYSSLFLIYCVIAARHHLHSLSRHTTCTTRSDTIPNYILSIYCCIYTIQCIPTDNI